MINLDKLRTVYKFGKSLSLNDANVLLKAAESKSIRRREIIFDEGSKDSTIFFIRKGLVRMYHVKDNGEEITFNLIPEYNIVANFEFIGTHKASKFYYEALEDCDTYSLDYNILEDIISQNPRLEASRKYILRRFIEQSGERVQSFVLMNAEERYLKFINDHPKLTDRVPNKYIAHMLGITPVTLSRIRSRMASKK